MFSLIKALTTDQSTLDLYYIKKRKEAYKKTHGIPRHIRLHNFLHWFLLPCIKALRIAGKRNLIIYCDRRTKTHNPTIYACTHIGGVDIETAFEAIKYPCWLFLGDPREVYKNLDGFMLGLNGVICLDSKDKDDRRIAKETAIQLLKHGGNLLIYPEGVWNISENLPVGKLFIGTAEMAIQSKADIVPIAVEFYGNDLCVAIGKNMDISKFAIEDKYTVNQLLRDELATLKWTIWEQRGISKRALFPDNYSETFVNKIIYGNKETSYTVQDVLNTMFIDKSITEYSQAFEHLNNIKPNLQTAFLFNKRSK